jgi:uncharacterized protein (TIRG00374 family)
MRQQIILGVVVGVLFMALAFLGIPLADFFEAVGQLKLGWLALFSALLGGQIVLQALRQQLMLRDVAAGMTFYSSLSIVAIGLFCVQAFPARLGELARPWLLRRAEGVPFGVGLGMLALERALDLVALLMTLVLVLLWVDAPSVELVVAGHTIDLAAWGWSTARVVVPLVAAAVLLLAVTGEVLIDRLAPLARRLLGVRVEGLIDFSRAFTRAFRTLRSPLRLSMILGLTTLIWAEVALMYFVLAHGFGLQEWLGYPESAGVMTITALGSLLPAPPGMAGVQEAFGRGALALFGVRGGGLDALALGYAVVAHWWQFLLVALAAMWSSSRQGLRLSELLARARRGYDEGE